jgi:WD40 repeat protein
MVRLSPPRPDDPLAERHGRERHLGAPLCGLGWHCGRLWSATGEGHVRLFDDALTPVVDVAPHQGAILSVTAVGERLLSGGDDGRVAATLADGSTAVLAEVKGRWIDHVAAGAGGIIAWSEGRAALVQPTAGPRITLTHPSTVGGLAFDPGGRQLAVAHYGGATVWSLDGGKPKDRFLAWKGSHVGIDWSPDGRMLVTIMQESALHGWRLSDGGNMRMAGYPGKPRRLSWSGDGAWLATSGAGGAVLWPFKGKSGPMGKSGELIGERPALSTAVACHPQSDVVAIGFEDGCVLLARRADKRIVLIKRPGSPLVAGLAWRADGAALAYGHEDGLVGLVVLAGPPR